jgi:hypothetical protein
MVVGLTQDFQTVVTRASPLSRAGHLIRMPIQIAREIVPNFLDHARTI